MRHLVIGQRQKAPKFSAFHWSPHGCLITIGQHFVTTRVVHLPKRTETSLITESDQSKANHQLLQLCTVRIAWSDSDQAWGPCIAAKAGSVLRFKTNYANPFGEAYILVRLNFDSNCFLYLIQKNYFHLLCNDFKGFGYKICKTDMCLKGISISLNAQNSFQHFVPLIIEEHSFIFKTQLLKS